MHGSLTCGYLFLAGNAVRTSKYTLYTLLPLNLSEQFSKLANIYFLIISLLQLFTNLSPTSKYTTAGPLLLVLMVNLLREMWEDSRRHRDDAQVKNQ
jgi:phospholipid-transporting ATPase